MTRIALEGITLLAEGVRLAVFHRAGPGAHTRDHPSSRAPRGGRAVELDLECASAAELPEEFAAIAAAGAVAIAEPVRQDRGHLTGFSADPEGDIHSLFAVLPSEG